jgi:hypothetical protein
MMFATMTECQENYWRGLVHGLLLMLPFVALTYRRTWQQQKPAEETKAPPVLGWVNVTRNDCANDGHLLLYQMTSLCCCCSLYS